MLWHTHSCLSVCMGKCLRLTFLWWFVSTYCVVWYTHTAHTVSAIFIIIFIYSFRFLSFSTLHSRFYLFMGGIYCRFVLNSFMLLLTSKIGGSKLERMMANSSSGKISNGIHTQTSTHTHTYVQQQQQQNYTKQNWIIHIQLMFQSTSDQFAKSISVMWQLPRCSGLFEISIVIGDHCENKK